MIIRLATQRDVPTIQKLNHDLFLSDNEHNHDLDCDWPYSEEGEKYFRDAVDSEKYLSIVAEVDGVVVGYLNGFLKVPSVIYLGKRAEIDNMCVDATFRAKGVGTALINEFKKWAKEHGVERLMVEAFSGNESAIEFYKQNGFTPYAEVLSQLV
jgi:GNAT superfamily N-acetyltransferase